MTLLIAQAKRLVAWRTNEDDLRLLSREPGHSKAIARGGDDRRAGRTKPWKDVKEELGLAG